MVSEKMVEGGGAGGEGGGGGGLGEGGARGGSRGGWGGGKGGLGGGGAGKVHAGGVHAVISPKEPLIPTGMVAALSVTQVVPFALMM